MKSKGTVQYLIKPAVIIGGGAAGFFAAIRFAETNPRRPVILLEQRQEFLSKVKISGGGRCNVTHACFDPKLLTGFYPRGGKELLGPFHRFQPKDTISWFERRGVLLKTEQDGRVFPVSDSSQTIIDTLVQTASGLGVQLRTGAEVSSVSVEEGGFQINIEKSEAIHCSLVLLATGSGRRAWDWARKLGHTIVPPVPSLFTFHVPDKRLRGLEGISVPHATIGVSGTKLIQTGPLLITHHGLSGPAVLKLSAWGARSFFDAGYHVELSINWIGWDSKDVQNGCRDIKTEYAKKQVHSTPAFGTPRRLWERLLTSAHIPDSQVWASLTREQIDNITAALTDGRYMVRGKTPFKDEFVTCGGVQLDEVNFKTMESRVCAGLYFAGEILNIDALTGGFNFQNAWTTGWLAASDMAIK